MVIERFSMLWLMVIERFSPRVSTRDGDGGRRRLIACLPGDNATATR